MTEFWTASFGTHGLGALQLLQLFGHFLLLSLLAVGGAITTAPEMQRYLVDQQGWLTAEQFSASVGLAQAAPGPNVLFIAVLISYPWHLLTGGSIIYLLSLPIGWSSYRAHERRAREAAAASEPGHAAQAAPDFNVAAGPVEDERPPRLN